MVRALALKAEIVGSIPSRVRGIFHLFGMSFPRIGFKIYNFARLRPTQQDVAILYLTIWKRLEQGLEIKTYREPISLIGQ